MFLLVAGIVIVGMGMAHGEDLVVRDWSMIEDRKFGKLSVGGRYAEFKFELYVGLVGGSNRYHLR